ncbi:phage tail protein [Thermoflavimicrobium dichotomicum]|uniref:Phage-related protein n=1 Tax=Thermoflavimicrobium dichotomicum TaxID=46223 RepID=A0A1I3UN03_9BACL|nr:hypothetical protein [Thermoflavimicrobium dichotomicum]SFJ83326.1 hypothetical protein SAMN05421852_12548 [Thermoflavimicrobium dichotomicum]
MELFRMFGEVALKGGKAVTSNLKVIDLEAARAARSLEAIPDKVETEVDVDTDKAESKISRLMNSFGTMQAGMMALGPAVIPVMASLAGLAGGLGASFAAAGAGVASFAAIAVPALKGVFDASKEVEKINEKIAKADTAKERAKAMKELQAVYGELTSQERKALKALQDFKSFWKSFVRSLQSPILDIFIKGLGTLKTTLEKLRPTFELSIDAVSQLFDSMDKALKGQEMQDFFHWLTRNASLAILNFGKAFGNVMRGIMHLLMAFEPVSHDMQNGLVGLTEKFANWAAGLKHSEGFKQFIAYVQANGPKLMNIIGQIAILIGKLIQSMAPFGPIVLDVVSALLQFVNWLLNLHPAVGPVLIGILQLAGIMRLLAGPIGSIIGLFKRMGPVFKAIGNGFVTFGKWIAQLGPIIVRLATGAFRLLVQGLLGIIRVLNLLRIAFMTNPFLLIITAVVALVAIIIYNWDTIKVYLIAAWNYIKAVAIVVWNAIKSFFISLWNGIKLTAIALWNAIKAFLVSLWNTIKFMAISVWNGLKSVIISIWNVIKSMTLTVWNVIKSFIITIWNVIKSFVTSAVNGVKNVITRIWNGIKSITLSVWNTIKNVVGNAITGAWNTIKGFASRFLSAGKGLLDAFINGIKSGFSRAIGAVKEGLAKIRSYLPFSPAKEGPLSDLDKSGESFFPTFASRMHKGLRPALNQVSAGMGQVRSLIGNPPLSAGANGTTLITGNTFIIREEADIQKVAEKLYQIQQRKSRTAARGGIL